MFCQLAFSKLHIGNTPLHTTRVVACIADAIGTMTSFYHYDQNPSAFCFLVQIRAFVIQTSLGLQNLNVKEKTKRILVVVVK